MGQESEISKTAFEKNNYSILIATFQLDPNSQTIANDKQEKSINFTLSWTMIAESNSFVECSASLGTE